MTEHVLITGASGCVGHYVAEELAGRPEYQVHLLVRSPAKLKLDPALLKQVNIIQADLGDFARYEHLLPELDFVVNLAAAWGDPKMTHQVNVAYPLALYDRLNPERCRRIIHFSTASILDRNNQLLPEANTIGTDYIRTKYQCYQQLAQVRLADRVTTVFPTLILGGGKDKPYSHVCSGLPALIKWFNLIQWVRVDGSFHFIHAHDIATIVHQLLKTSTVEPLLVLGNPSITINECIEQATEYLGRKVPWTYELTLARARQLVKWLPISMAPWDDFCMGYRHFRYNAVNAATFGLPVVAGTVEEVLGMYGSQP
ncbi:NAD-dependent epimerase/dehydratase family protein [Anthocerotibacter panamensis]|uniref:NAD-dependent epimerase/dehydratase family protein n=1 Tax=Anthocerotibacter panamensis TaxID=2857077 RepID=UPI001C4073A1|nr:NAD(P)-dependent oxidoreductase [Anthocerotibacter panamensis]